VFFGLVSLPGPVSMVLSSSLRRGIFVLVVSHLCVPTWFVVGSEKRPLPLTLRPFTVGKWRISRDRMRLFLV